jgi:broad specificity phosphatase PhoE
MLPRNAVSLLLLAFISVGSLSAQEPTLIYLVRHAEKVDESRDPPLSEAGTERAAVLAHILKDAGITHIHSTPFQRTVSTGQPVAQALGLEIRRYDGGELEAMASLLEATPGRHLVVGHSNTVPELVGALGGDPGESYESLEYDRLYLLVLSGTEVSTILLRYGAPFTPGGD